MTQIRMSRPVVMIPYAGSNKSKETKEMTKADCAFLLIFASAIIALCVSLFVSVWRVERSMK